MSAEGAALQTFPPILALFCMWIEPINSDASERAGKQSFSAVRLWTSVQETAAPIRKCPLSSSRARSSGTLLRSTTKSAFRRLLFSWSITSVLAMVQIYHAPQICLIIYSVARNKGSTDRIQLLSHSRQGYEIAHHDYMTYPGYFTVQGPGPSKSRCSIGPCNCVKYLTQLLENGYLAGQLPVQGRCDPIRTLLQHQMCSGTFER